ncbi:hypothetical protein FRY74_06385 [Vicingus serpentipes]|uniref:Uncharacterized protein n=1 Tax=Vicingus serpentipes TaxID=1926625 RepID=A0A5C6RVS5_9FLAO|nr:hypothetical protein [Vicingus serpentipes]TXB66197.1 hypothetical protein FRY74_06385 [Vicingus serpentipes]
MNQIELNRINESHIMRVDKLYRMHGGLSSRLISYQNQTMFLEIIISNRWRKDNLTTANQIAKCWKEYNNQLANSSFFNVKIKRTEGETGFVMGLKEKQSKTDLKKKIENLVRGEKNTILIETIKGTL